MRNRRTRFKSNNNNLDIIHITKIILEILIIVCLLIFIFSSINLKKRSSSLIKISEDTEFKSDTNTTLNSEDNLNLKTNLLDEENTSSEKKDENKSTTINMALTGDIMCHNTIYKDAFNSELDTYDFSYLFDDIKYNIQTADIAIR